MSIALVAEDEEGASLSPGCARAGLAFFMRSVERLVALTGGNLMDGIILVAVMCGNIPEFLTRDRTDLPSSFSIPPDEARRPVSVYAISKQLMIPYETARRHVMSLADRGFCVRVGREGVIVPSAAVRRLVSSSTVPDTVRDLGLLIAQLDALGALEERKAATSNIGQGSKVVWIG